MELINYFAETSSNKNIWINPQGNSYGDQKLIKEINEKLSNEIEVQIPDNYKTYDDLDISIS